jgi:hypothetical protein
MYQVPRKRGYHETDFRACTFELDQIYDTGHFPADTARSNDNSHTTTFLTGPTILALDLLDKMPEL